MKAMHLADLLAPFFTQHLRQHRNVSQHTVAAYRDTFRLLFRFFKENRRRPPVDLELSELAPERILAFLDHLERERNNTVRSRNARLAAIRCFVHYVQDLLGPDLPEPTRRILTIPPKRHSKPILGFLTRPELEAILNGCGDTWTGQRDRLLFLLLYNTGARISEVLGLRVREVIATGARFLALHGKGRKERTVPLWTDTQT
ncbi:MAG: tyrosine-type recombinase/integrase, partial [Limisphaerales bacterium]